ncbi:MAG: hypothetical protein JKY08_00005 [Flavobacteriaceae bacterium]|nr:hypothetical protein [Flavobacteriaceae bacterium]
MRVLTANYWEAFVEKHDNDTSHFNGKLFEELVRDLLKVYFNGEWNPTSITWDGGKDFVNRSIPGTKSWAECKMYKKPISLNAVSNTLVMAINEQNVNSLLIFSYSPINKNTKSHLASFSHNSDISIQTFDDETLESLILSCKSICEKYFNQCNDYDLHETREGLEIVSICSTDVDVDYSQISCIEGNLKKRTPKIPVNTPCLYEIYIRSKEAFKQISVKIDLTTLIASSQQLGLLNMNKLVLDKNNCIVQNILPCQISSTKIFFAPKVVGRIIFPIVETAYNGNVVKLPAYEIDVTRLTRPSLIGSSVIRELNKFNEAISTNNKIFNAVISGKSGVGKTRFIEEAELRLLSQNFIVVKLDGRFNQCKDFSAFSTSLISQIWRLPNSELLLGEEVNIINRSTFNNTLFDRIYSIIYRNKQKTLSSEDDIKETLDLVSTGLVRQRIALLLDNVQSLDSFSIKMLSKLTDNLRGTPGQSVITFSFNEDELVYSTEATLLLHQLKKTSLISDSRSLQYIRILEFSRNDVEMFLDTICGTMDDNISFTEHYPNLTNLIYESVLSRPFDLYQLFLAAQDDNLKIAYVSNGFFFVQKLEKFHSLIKNVNKKTEKILEIRLLNLMGNENALKVILALAYIGESDNNIIQQITESKKHSINYLIRGGWIKDIGGNRLDFFHPSIERYIIKTLNGNIADRLFYNEIKKKIEKGIVKVSYDRLFPLALFSIAENKTDILAIKAISQIKEMHNSSITARTAFFSQEVFNFIISTQVLLPQVYLDCVQTICKLSSEGNIEDFTGKLLTFKQKLFSFTPTTDKEALDFFKISRQYASYSSSLGRPQIGDRMLIEELEYLDKLPDSILQDTKKRIRVNLLNRRCVCLKDMGAIDEATKVGHEALNIASESGFKSFVCLSYMDLSAIYKNKKQDLPCYMKYLNQAISYYHKHKSEIDIEEPSIELSCIENEAKIKGLTNDYNASILLADELISKSKEINDIYYLLRGLITKAIFMARLELGKENANDYKLDLIQKVTNEIEDISITAKYDKFYIKALHLHAILSSINKSNLRAKDFYISALYKLKEMQAFDRYIQPSNLALIYDAIIFWKSTMPNEKFPLSKSFFYKYKIESIYSELEYNDHVKSNMLFANKTYNFPFP